MTPKSGYRFSDKVMCRRKSMTPKSMPSGLTRGWAEFSDKVMRMERATRQGIGKCPS